MYAIILLNRRGFARREINKEDTPMNQSFFRRSLGLGLALVLLLSALPISALAAEDAEFTLIQLVATDVTLDETVFEYTGSEIRPNVTVRAGEHLLTLDKDYRLEYADNVEVGQGRAIVTGIATASETVGYTGTVEIPFTIREKAPEAPEEPEFILVELKGTDVTLDATSFPYTGEPIEPAVTVNVGGKTLVKDRDYAVEYINNLLPGTGTVIVRGIATASETLGYTGEIRIDFTVLPIPEEDPEEQPGETPEETPGETPEETPEETPGETPEETPGEDPEDQDKPETPTQPVPPVALTEAHVTLEGTKFFHTGKAIEPKVTVTVEGKTLTPGKDYLVKYENNVDVGTAAVTVSAIEGESGGYSGSVKKTFTIVPDYRITQGHGGKWYQGSSQYLSFTANGDYRQFTGVSVAGRLLEKQYYEAKSGTQVLLKTNFLNKLAVGDYTVTLHFTDGDATGIFTVAAGSDPTNPQTGDTFPLHALTAVLFISLTALIGLAYVHHKKTRK